MRIAYFDCFAGLTGEMLLGALLCSGLPLDKLRATLSGLPFADYTLDSQVVGGKELSGTRLTIKHPQTRVANGNQHHINGNAVTPNGSNGHTGPDDHATASAACIIEQSNLPDIIKGTSLAIFGRLAQAETAVFPRWTDMRESARGVDLVLTVVGVVAGLSLLDIDRVECSPLHVGSGVARTSYGLKPTISPITLEILRSAGVPVYGSDIGDAIVTPEGAAIITSLASAFGPIPSMKIAAIGYGAGYGDPPDASNVVRLLIGDTLDRGIAAPSAPVVETSTPLPVDSTEPAEAASTEARSRPFIASQEEWVTLSIQGHQQNGRQRSPS